MASRLLVLRFRDIEVKSGETIRLHRELIDSYGYCWWGWLARDYERNPQAELTALDTALQADHDGKPYPVALYHTGLGRVYVATCECVRVSPASMRSPEVDFTPDYYRNKDAPAWFKLRSISPADSSFIVGRTCLGMPSAGASSHLDLLGKPIEKLEDLRRQEVTLWVIQ